MQGARQQIILEFFEKLFAILALSIGSMLSPIALFSLLSRRVGWRQLTHGGDQAKTIALREVSLFLALAVGSVFLRPLESIPFDRNIVTALCLILSFGAMFLAERSSTALIPAFKSSELQARCLRNLAGWILLGLSLAAFAKGVAPPLFLPGALIGMLFSLVPLAVAGRRGEPGLLIPGAAVYLAGIALAQPFIAAAGLGVTLPTAVLVTHNLKASFPTRGLLAALAAVAGLVAPPLAAPIAAALLFALTLEMWPLTLRLAVLVFLRSAYRFRIYGAQNYAADGAGLLLSNHVTMLDGFLLGAFTQRMVRFLVFDAFYKNPVAAFILHLFRTVSISQGARRDVVESLRKARAGIEEGHFAGIFPEGGITRSGHLHPFQKGFTRLVSGTQIPVIPAYMNGLWTSLLSFGERRVHLRIPRLFRAVEIEYGEPLPSTVTAIELWRIVKHLEVNAAFRDSERAPILPLAFLAAARQFDNKPAIVAGGKTMTYGALASTSLLFARHINRRIRRKKRFGVFLPDGTDRVIAHVSLVLAGHVAMDIPDLRGTDYDSFVQQHGLSAIVTSQSWLQSHDIAKTEAMFFIGRVIERIDSRDRSRIWIYRTLSPHRAWRQVCTLAMRRESAAAIVTSPRGPVVLSHRGIAASAAAMRRVLWFKPGVTVRNQAPLHRSAGLTLGFWMPLLHGATLILDQAPAHFEIVTAGNLAAAHPDSNHVVIIDDAGAEIPLDALDDRCLPLFEIAEAGGALALSSPTVKYSGEIQHGAKPGSWGRLPFGLEIQETPGGLKFRSPSRLLRYLDSDNATDATAKSQARVDDWLELELPFSLSADGFLERRSTSEPQISSPPPAHQSSSDPQGE